MSHLSRTAKYSYQRLKLVSKPVIALPLIVFAVFVIAAVASYVAALGSLDTARGRVIERRAQENALRLSTQLSTYTIVARGGVGYAMVNTPTAEGWNAFVSAYNISSSFPTINAVTYAQVMNHDDAQALVDERNAEVRVSTFSLSPAKPATDPYVMTRYVVPNVPAFSSRLGIDEYAVPSRKEAITRAMVTNSPALTSEPQQIKPATNPDAAPQPGFIIFAPIYDTSKPLGTVAERKAAFVGTSNVSFLAKTFFDSMYIYSEHQTHTYLTVFQGDSIAAPKIYEGGIHPSANDRVGYIQKIVYAGQTFTYRYEFSDSDLLTSVERYRPLGLLIAGIFFGALLALTMLFSIRARLLKLTTDKEHEIQLAKDELLSLASHQLRTPATGVKQYMGMVLQGFAGEITSQQKDFLQKAYDSNDRQLHVINDILHLAKLDAGRIVLTKTTFDMRELISSVLDEQHESAVLGEVRLTSKMPKKLMVFADSHMMRMVVENIVSNAIKYTHPGGKITVTLKNADDSYALSVKDTGVGIAEQDMDKLFKQFSRVANERSHLVSGTGVGLYLVKNLVELHGGKVEVITKVGKGTTFTISFRHETTEL